MMLCWRQLSFSYEALPVLNNITADVQRGELLGVIGANGAGKSSLLQLTAGVIPMQHGAVELFGRSADKLSVSERAKRVSYLPQIAAVEWPLNVRQVVALGRLPHSGMFLQESDDDVVAITEAMLNTDVIALAERRMTTLSGGERMRVMIARMLATQAELLLADEPIAALDLLHQLQIMQLFKQHCERGGAAVIALHDLNMAARFCDRLLLLHNHQMLVSGTPTQVLTSDHLSQAYGVTVAINEHAGRLCVHPL